jgi:peptide/nickel transport system permease protein
VVLIVSIIIFTLLYFIPGDPAAALLGDNPTQQMIEEKYRELGLDQSYYVQLFRFLKSTFIDFDLGTSYIDKTSVTNVFLSRFPRTAIIAGVVCLLTIVIAIPLGVVAAVNRNKWQDRFCSVLAIGSSAIPNFWFAMILILIFSLYLNWLPSFGIGSWYHYVLPCTANGLMGLGVVARQTRSQMLECIRSDYIITARSKGVSERSILYRHALPNAIIPVITSLGITFGHALGGSIVIEQVFTIPGVGMYLLTGINKRDYPIVRGCVVMLAVLFTLVVLLIDIAYAYVDPRIKSRYEAQQKRWRFVK